MKRANTLIRAMVAVVATLSGGGVLFGQARQSVDNVWTLVPGRPQTATAARTDIVGQAAIVRLDRAAFDALVQTAPGAAALRTPGGGLVLSLPLADGTFERFRVANSPMLAPELAAAFPEIRTFTGQGIDDPTATTRFGWTSAGFHAIVLSAAGTVYVDPYAPGDLEFYVAVSKSSLQQPGIRFQCLVTDSGQDGALRTYTQFPASISNGTSLRTYRLSLAANGEYTTAAGGTKPAALARMVTTMNRVNGIYQRELAVTMTLSTTADGDPTGLIFTNSITDPYTNNNGSTMLTENQTYMDAHVGTANYDIGHVFSTGGGGVASLNAPCSATLKARGVTGSSSPTGDSFDVDYVAHEVGHQFGGNHTFNTLCGGNRSAAHATEVGSGSTIQAYAGICPPEDLQPNSNDYFTFESLNEMTAFITSGGGSTCGTASATGNTVPTVTAAASYTIPISTPFVLTAAGADANGDTLTYDWEQHSFGTVSTNVATATTDDGTRPLFRSYSPSASVSRFFPSLTYILNNANTPPTTYACSLGSCLTGETLPTTSRTMTFQVTVRDNRAGGGGIITAPTNVTTTTTSGPFLVTSPNTAVAWNSGAQTVTWNVAGTTGAPVSAANVRILLSTDGGTTFGTELIASTPNDGSEVVTLPNVTTSTARIKVEAVGNIFFDVSDANFSIAATMFTNDPLVAGTTTLRAVHITELRTYINTIRARYGAGAYPYTNATLTAASTRITAVDINELQAAVVSAYNLAGLTPPTFTTVVAGTTTITAARITAIRNAVIAIY